MMNKSLLLKIWNFWPPFWGSGIVINKTSPDLSYVQMKLKKRPWTKNLIGTQYGGSIFSMTDPIYMTILTYQLGKGYRVIDKSASIQFLKLGKTELTAEFRISPEEIQKIKTQLIDSEKLDWKKEVFVKNSSNETVAIIEKVISIRKLPTNQ